MFAAGAPPERSVSGSELRDERGPSHSANAIRDAGRRVRRRASFVGSPWPRPNGATWLIRVNHAGELDAFAARPSPALSDTAFAGQRPPRSAQA